MTTKARAHLPLTGLGVTLGCVALSVVGLLWPGLADAAAATRPDTLSSVALDGLLCFGPLGMPLAGMGAVVVWLEERS